MKYTIALLLIFWSSCAFADVSWQSSLSAAKIQSAKTRKPILVDFSATWCGPCRQMEQDTFSNAAVKAALKNVICVRLDVDKNQAEAQTYQINAIPRVMLLPSNGGPAILDTEGYRGPQDFLDELSKALHLKSSAAGVSGPAANPDLTAVKTALSSKSYGALKAKNPKQAAAGLHGLVQELGVFEEPQIAPMVVLLSNAGDDALPALIAGLSDKTLAVRAGAYRTLQTLLRTRQIATNLTYDPWASAKARQIQAQRWSAWWKQTKPAIH
ncbi:MAG: thioredoxin family protein [Capsulimonas sp.]|uniref:thioredoxin family protein n=1 Tax=Capsulimonas sp. TaxID=2494211 RepID=UPI003266A89D